MSKDEFGVSVSDSTWAKTCIHALPDGLSIRQEMDTLSSGLCLEGNVATYRRTDSCGNTFTVTFHPGRQSIISTEWSTTIGRRTSNLRRWQNKLLIQSRSGDEMRPVRITTMLHLLGMRLNKSGYFIGAECCRNTSHDSSA